MWGLIAFLDHKIFPPLMVGVTAYNMLLSIAMVQVNTGNSILSELTKRELSKKVGHFGFDITYKTKEGKI